MKDSTDACFWSRVDIVSGLLQKALLPPSPLPYYTADGKTVSAVIVTLRVDIRQVRMQVATVRSRIASIRPPEATYGTIEDVAIGTTVEARTEKVERSLVAK